MNECFKQKKHVFYLIWTRLIYQTSQKYVHIEKKIKLLTLTYIFIHRDIYLIQNSFVVWHDRLQKSYNMCR